MLLQTRVHAAGQGVADAGEVQKGRYVGGLGMVIGAAGADDKGLAVRGLNNGQKHVVQQGVVHQRGPQRAGDAVEGVELGGGVFLKVYPQQRAHIGIVAQVQRDAPLLVGRAFEDVQRLNHGGLVPLAALVVALADQREHQKAHHQQQRKGDERQRRSEIAQKQLVKLAALFDFHGLLPPHIAIHIISPIYSIIHFMPKR